MQLKIRTKLFGIGMSGLVLALVLGGTSWWGLESVADGTEAVNTTTSAIRHHMESDMMHDALRADVLAAILAQSPEEHEAVAKDLAEHAGHFRDELEENAKLPLDAELHSALNGVKPELESYIAHAEKTVKLAVSDANAAKAELPKFLETFGVLEGRMSSLSDLIEKSATKASEHAAEVQNHANVLLLTIVTATAAILAGLAYFVARSITRPLSHVVEQLRDIAEGEGDLTKRLALQRTDEIGELSKWFDVFMTHLHKIMLDLRNASRSVGVAATELSAATSQISDGAQRQASGLEETAANLERLTQTVRKNADSASQANQLADGARTVAEAGGSVVGSAVSAMSEINQSSRKIADIITTIDEIAFQTNLLALNAAVEAARAGEQGRGFAVVAAEVRSLAQRSASAAREIKGLIQDSVSKIGAGTELVNRSGSTLTEIVDAVKRVTAIVAEIAAASKEQATGVGQINHAVSDIDKITQANASQAEEISGTASALSTQSRELDQLVGQFKVDTQG